MHIFRSYNFTDISEEELFFNWDLYTEMELWTMRKVGKVWCVPRDQGQNQSSLPPFKLRNGKTHTIMKELCQPWKEGEHAPGFRHLRIADRSNQILCKTAS